MIAVLGWLVGVIDVAKFVPRARRVYRRRHHRAAIRGLSAWTWTITTVQGAAWVVYGFADHLLPVAVPNMVITPVCAAILAVRISHRVRPDDS